MDTSVAVRPSDAAVANPRQGEGMLLALPAAATAVLGEIGLRNRQLWQDELATWWSSTLSTSDFRFLTSHTDAVFTPYYYFMRGWVYVFGSSAGSLRVPSLLAMVLATLLVTLLGRRLYGTRAGVVAGFVFTVIPAVTRYAQEARPYALVVAGATLSTLLLLRAAERSTVVRWALYAAALAATMSLHLISVLLLLAHGAWMLGGRRDRSLVGWLVAVAVGLGPAGVVAAQSLGQRGQVSWIDTTGRSTLLFPVDLFLSALVVGPVLVLAGVAAYRGWSSDRRDTLLLGTWALAPVVVLFLAIPVIDLALPRYALFTLPAWAILAGRTVAGIRLVHPVWAPAAVVAVLFAVSLPGQVAVRRDPDWVPDLRSVAASLPNRLRDSDGIAYADTSWRERLGLTHEFGSMPRRPRDVFLAVPAQRLGTYAAGECADPHACAADVDRLWFVTPNTTGDPFADVPPAKAAVLRDEFRIARDEPYRRVRLLLLTRR